MEREFWLKHLQLVPRPRIFASKSLPRSLVRHLLLHKSDTAVKRKDGHKITKLQGACHSLVVPLGFPIYMDGVTTFRNGRHVIDPLPRNEPPFVVVSALVQPDFEFKSVMYEMIRLENQKVRGKSLSNSAISYSDQDLKSNMIYHFTQLHELPAATEVTEDDLNSSGNFIQKGEDLLSIEMLRNIIREQIRIEILGLGNIAKEYGIDLVYTWDPPSIFAKTLDIDILENLWAEAISLCDLTDSRIVAVAYNDFRNKNMIAKLREKLPTSVSVCSKSSIDLKAGQFKVLHSNGDAFAEHIRTQPSHSSLDGAIGSASSAAACFCSLSTDSFDYV